MLITETANLKKLDHPNIAKTFAFLEEKDKYGKLYSVQEIGDLGRIADMEEETDSLKFTMNEQVKERVKTHVDNASYAPFCLSLDEKIA